MPQLAPLMWLFSAFLFVTMLSVILSVLWWQQHPIFPTLPTHSSSTTDIKWLWN